MDVDLSDCVAGGYFLARLSQRQPWMSSELLPDRILSGCGHICTFFPDVWAMNWTAGVPKERGASASAFGVPESRLPDVVSWANESFGKAFGYPRVLYSQRDATAALSLLGPPVDSVVLFGLGLPKDLVGEFLNSARRPAPTEGRAPVWGTGYLECLSRGEPLAGGGSSLGYELLSSAGFGDVNCSWLCNGLEQQLHEKSGLVPNAHGFIDGLDIARDCIARIYADEVKAEPEYWFPWLIV